MKKYFAYSYHLTGYTEERFDTEEELEKAIEENRVHWIIIDDKDYKFDFEIRLR